MTRLRTTEIDPFHRYDDDRVSVRRGAPTGEAVVCTKHFAVRRTGRKVELTHWLRASELDDRLAELLAAELFRPGWLAGVDVFERVLTGVVMSTLDDPFLGWTHFYRNTLRRAARPVHQEAMRLIGGGHVLDVGSGLGFLALRLGSRASVVASDVSPWRMRLLERMASAVGVPLRTLVCDGARVPLPDGAVDTVSVVHVLERLEVDHGLAVVREAVRLARRRVVVAVSVEDLFGGGWRIADLERFGGRAWVTDGVGWVVVESSSAKQAQNRV